MSASLSVDVGARLAKIDTFLYRRGSNQGLEMKQTMTTCAIALLVALIACSPKAHDNCKQHTGDGLCADGNAASGAT